MTACLRCTTIYIGASCPTCTGPRAHAGAITIVARTPKGCRARDTQRPADTHNRQGATQ